MYTYIYIYICINVCTYIHIYTYIHTCICTQIRVCNRTGVLEYFPHLDQRREEEELRGSRLTGCVRAAAEYSIVSYRIV